MDFIEGLPKSMTPYSCRSAQQYALLIALKHPFSAFSIALVFTKEVVRLHGVPHSDGSNCDKVFKSLFWTELFFLQGTLLKRSSSYHPQIDKQTKVVYCSLETYLHCFASDKPKQWSRWLPWSKYLYNTSYHNSIHTTLFRALYGRGPPLLIQHKITSSLVFEVDQIIIERDAILEKLKSHLI